MKKKSIIAVGSLVVALVALRAAAVDCPTGQCPLVPPPVAAPSLPEIQFDKRPIARLENSTDAARSFGSGTLVDVDGECGLIVTCAHLFREGTGRVVVTFAEQSPTDGRVLKIDVPADLAAVSVSAPPIPPVELASDYPQRGDALVSCGYGSDGRLWCNRGQALGYVVTLGSHGRETLELSGTARLGDSGGPVFNERGELAGVLFGTNGRVVDATFCGRVRKFLEGLSPRFGGGQTDESDDAANGPLVKLPPRRRPPREEPPESDAGTLDEAAGAVGAAAETWLSAKATALLISVGVPGGIAGLASGAIVWFVMRRTKRKLRTEIDELRTRIGGQQQTDRQPSAAANDPSQQKLVERHHNRYVAYEAGDVDKAWAAAHARVSEKYPGAVPYLKIVEGVKDQLLSGIDQPQFS